MAAACAAGVHATSLPVVESATHLAQCAGWRGPSQCPCPRPSCCRCRWCCRWWCCCSCWRCCCSSPSPAGVACSGVCSRTRCRFFFSVFFFVLLLARAPSSWSGCTFDRRLAPRLGSAAAAAAVAAAVVATAAASVAASAAAWPRTPLAHGNAAATKTVANSACTCAAAAMHAMGACMALQLSGISRGRPHGARKTFSWRALFEP